MADLFTNAEFAAYLQTTVGELKTATVDLLRDLLLELIEDVTGSLADVDPLPASVRTVALDATRRAYLNPQGYTSETAGGFTYRREGKAAEVGLYLTDDERADLDLAFPDEQSAAAFTIGPAFDTSPWVRTSWPLPSG